jgi:hypothetical protein
VTLKINVSLSLMSIEHVFLYWQMNVFFTLLKMDYLLGFL